MALSSFSSKPALTAKNLVPCFPRGFPAGWATRSMHGPTIWTLQHVGILRHGQPLSLIRFMSAGGMRPAFLLLCRIKPRLEPIGLYHHVRLLLAALVANGHTLADDILRAADTTAPSVPPFVLASRFVSITATLAIVWGIYFTGFPHEVVF